MKYKIGDKVRIRTNKDIKKEYEVSTFISLDIEEVINKNFPDRILTIISTKKLHNLYNCYEFKEIERQWNELIIERLAKDYKKPIPISNRWEILDL